MADQYIFTMYKLNKFYGQKQVLKDISLCFFPGAKIGIVGENGSGKSTVLRIMGGQDDQFLGQAQISKGYKAGCVPQEPKLDENKTVRQELESAFSDIQKLMVEYDDVTAKLSADLDPDAMQAALDRLAELQDKLDAADAWNLDQQLNQASEALCLPDDNRIIGTLSGGEKRRVALCKALLERPDLLLLDEPTNHLDAETVDWLEAQLKDYPGTVIIVTHDRYFLDNITKWILELEGGHGIPFEGNYSSWLEQKITRMAASEKTESSRRKTLQRELDWIRMSNKDRRELARHRLAEYEQLVARENASIKDDASVIQIAPGPLLGDQVLEFHNVSKGFDNAILIKELNFVLPKAAVVGLVGPNGAGKTTLFKMIVGEEKPDAGEVILGSTVKLSYVSQGRDDLVGEHSVLDEISGGASEILIGRREVPARQYISRFGFRGPDQQKAVKDLSGGERNRCHLAKLLKTGGNLLLLDEPTNDLDVNTLRLLEEAIHAFSGCVMLISHDRFFLNRVCTHLLVFEGGGFVRWFEGNYQQYEEWRIKEAGVKPFENRRARYRKIVRA
ncbi:MAG TPA: energy-dependent translational throttle protein EttA [Candidatus Sumerlaeota bacterium]|nr:MAG: putative ABC transporter ATP-binding protein [candidate division BRC1 bacterium ADurb.Bin183]HOE64839.1 energy-dependent translational throttle protein EttA [Candidatus Sumerlaeota bacterium]HRR29885.1 energy-dependent translational throttle protein EttA [Candidatus Sumerlaeia bacterium]HON50654.1 energy-dependent translational throttle protein EttA [Candidatus Sumerlaeota bacterium]HOR65228.1 energy-dependent translational throttle protein EttA [Candidatus Sumerlaeota bacterium]